MLFEPIRILTAKIQKALRHQAVSVVSCGMIQPHECNFNFLMPGNAVFIHESVYDAICKTNADIQKFSLPHRFKKRYGSLNQMTCTIKLMAFKEVSKSVFWFFYREIGVYIAVFLLTPADQIHNFVHAFFKCRIIFQIQ